MLKSVKKDFIFAFQNKEIKKSISIDDLTKFPLVLLKALYIDGIYNVKSFVDEQNLQNILDYLIDKNKELIPTVANSYDYKILCEEFDIDSSFIPEDTLEFSIINKFQSLKSHDQNAVNNKNDIENKISENLDHYLTKNEKEMLQIPATSLHNIFFNDNRKLTNHELAYQFIIKKNNPSLYILLPTLSYERLSQESRNDSLKNADNRFGFLPKIDYSVFEEHENLFYKLYVANIKNRLNEITNPANEDKIRWVMELIQNAKDSLYISPVSNQITDKKVKIDFIITRNTNNNLYEKVIFKHNGPPFSINSYYGLIYKISEGKNNKVTTGRFGTGFLTTHVLSKRVKISGDRFEKDNKLNGFSIEMIREGRENDEIIRDIQEMETTFRKHDHPLNYTQFEYQIKTELSSECVELGLNHFKKHIYNVLINCPDVECISLTENESTTIYSLLSKTENIFQFEIFTEETNKENFVDKNEDDSNQNATHMGSISLYKLAENNSMREFIVINDDKNISITVEFKDNKIIPKKEGQESLYTVFPLVGSSTHVLPFSINCPDFEPTTERNALLLDGEEKIDIEENINSERKIISEETKCGTNRKIFLKSICLFDQLVQYLINNKISNIYELTTGLILNEKPYNTIDMNWYNEKYLNRLRSIVTSNVKVKTISNEEIILGDVFIPDKSIEDKHLDRFITLSTTTKYYPKIICLEDCLIWRARLWNTLNYVTVEDIIEKAREDSILLKEENLSSLNALISFVFDCKKSLFEIYSIIPDMNCKLHCMKKDKFRKSHTVSDEIINILEDISPPKMHNEETTWRSTHMHKKIKDIFGNEIPEDETIDAENCIIEQIKSDQSSSIKLMKYVLKNDKHREKMFYFVTQLHIADFKKEYVHDISPSVWILADKIVMKKIVNRIQLAGIEKSDIISFSKEFIPVFQDHFIKDKKFINSSKVIPNANCDLDCLDNLVNKSEIFHDHLNSVIKSHFSKDFNNKIIHPVINSIIKSENDENILEMLDVIKNGISNLSAANKIKVAECVISIVPNENNLVSSIEDQNNIFDLYTKLINPNLHKISIKNYMFSVKHWENSNKIIIKRIRNAIEETKTLDQFMKKFQLSNQTEAFSILNFLYKYDFLFKKNKHPIIPNREGEFKLKNALTTNPGIDEEFYALLSSLDDTQTIHKGIVHILVKIDNLTKFNIQNFFEILSNSMDKAVSEHNDKAELVKKFLNFDVNKFSNRSVEGMKDKMDLLSRAHISFIYSRIRDITSPSKYDYYRWPYELIQNATDCIQKNGETLRSDKNGTIEFKFAEDNVTFTHYGSAFTNDNLISLLYQYGGGKNGTNSIGRFGTGFLSTLILSRIVHVSGDLEIFENGSKCYKGFKVTINREGNNKNDLKRGIEIMEETKKLNLDEQRQTTFIFDIQKKSKLNMEAYKEGYEGLKNYIPQALIFNPSIKKIILEKDNEKVEYSKGKSSDEQIKTIDIKTSEKTVSKSFIYSEAKHQFQYEGKSETINKNVTINCIVEIGPNNNIIYNEEFLYLSFPILGKKAFYSPIIINSLQFEPERERNGIVIQLDTEKEDSYEAAINKFIISKCVDLFKEIINIAIRIKCTDLFNFCQGINIKTDIAFFRDNFILKMREVFQSFSIFETNKGFKKYSEIYIPFIENYKEFNLEKNNEDEIYKMFYDIVSKLTSNSQFCDIIHLYSTKFLVKFNQCKQWVKTIWEDFDSKITIDDFLEFISKKKNIKDFQYISSPIEFFNNIIQFLTKSNKIKYYINRYSFLVNKNGDIVSERSLYNFKNDLPKEVMSLLNDVGYDYNKDIIHPNIIDLSEDFQFQPYDIGKAINSVKENINNNNFIKIMKYVISNDKKRETMYILTKKCLDEGLQKVVFDIPLGKYKISVDEMFKRADNIAYNKLIERIQQIDIKENISIIHDFVSILYKNLPFTDFNTKKIFPNQYYELNTPNQLKENDNIDQDLIDLIKENYNYDIKKFLVEKSFVGFSNFPKYSGYDLDKVISPFLIDIKTNLDVKKLCTIVFPYYHPTNDEKFTDIVQITSFFLKINIEEKADLFSRILISKVEKVAINFIINYISKFNNISDIKDLPQNEIFKNLPLLYKYSLEFNNNSGKIYPNDSGQLFESKEIKIVYDNNFTIDTLYNLFDFLIKFDPKVSQIRNKCLNKSIEVTNDISRVFRSHRLTIIDAYYIRRELLKFKSIIINYYREQNESDNNNSDTNSIAAQFINYIKKEKDLQVFFNELLSEVDKTLPPKVFQKRHQISSLIEIQEIFDQFEKQIDLKKIMDTTYFTSSVSKLHLMKVAIYDNLKNNNLFKNPECLFISSSTTNTSVNYKGGTYYIDAGDHKCDFSAEDSQKHKFYFVVKTDFEFSPMESSFQFRLMMTSHTEYFIVILIDNSYNATIQWKGKI